MKPQLSFRSHAHHSWPSVWLGLAFLWATFSVLGTWLNYQLMAVRGRPITWVQSIRMNLFEYGLWALILTPLILALCSKLPLARTELSRLVPAHLLSIVGIFGLDVSIKTLMAGRMFPGGSSHPFAAQFRRYLYSEVEGDIQIYLLIAVIAYVVAYYNDLRKQERHAAELETDLVRAQLQVLKMQLQPHFLFNTLHSIGALVHSDQNAAHRMICSLGDFLRMTLAAEDLPKVTLRRELECLERYLEIQRVRFQGRLSVEIRVADELLDATVPYLLLQPLVENAIKHGVARRSGLSKVEACIRGDSGNLLISVVNDLGAQDEVGPEERLGIGLENIRNRLRILYDSQAGLLIEELPEGRFRVQVRLPIERSELSDADVGLEASAVGPSFEVLR